MTLYLSRAASVDSYMPSLSFESHQTVLRSGFAGRIHASKLATSRTYTENFHSFTMFDVLTPAFSHHAPPFVALAIPSVPTIACEQKTSQREILLSLH